MPLKLAKLESEDTGKYGDPVGKKIIGVEADSVFLPTRLHQWQLLTIQEVKNRLPETVWTEDSGEARSARTDAPLRARADAFAA